MTERLKSSKFKDVNERLTSATTIKINKSGTMFCLDFLLINTKGISVKYKILNWCYSLEISNHLERTTFKIIPTRHIIHSLFENSWLKITHDLRNLLFSLFNDILLVSYIRVITRTFEERQPISSLHH